MCARARAFAFSSPDQKSEKEKQLRGNRNLSSSSPAFDRLDGIKKETGEEANESETEEEENGRGGGVACGGGSRLMLPGILDVICVQL